jgi:hypothetical protein
MLFEVVEGPVVEMSAGTYSTNTVLTRPGSWLLVVTAEPSNCGCFLVNSE